MKITKKTSVKEVLNNMTSSDFLHLTKRETNILLDKTTKLARRRFDNLIKKGINSSAVNQTLTRFSKNKELKGENVFKHVRGKISSEKEELYRQIQFLRNPTSTIKGTEEHNKNARERILSAFRDEEDFMKSHLQENEKPEWGVTGNRLWTLNEDNKKEYINIDDKNLSEFYRALDSLREDESSSISALLAPEMASKELVPKAASIFFQQKSRLGNNKSPLEAMKEYLEKQYEDLMR